MQKTKNSQTYQTDNQQAKVLIGLGILFLLLTTGVIGGLFELVFGFIGLVFGLIGTLIGVVFGTIGAVIGVVFGTLGGLLGLIFGTIVLWLPLVLIIVGAKMLFDSRQQTTKSKNDIF